MSKRENQSIRRSSSFKNLSLTTLGWELALPIFGGALSGYYLDNALRTQYALTILLLVVGIFFGYYNLIKLIDLEILRSKAADQRQNNRETKT